MSLLAQELRRSIEGEVRFSAGDRALYAADSSNYREVPLGVVIPRTVEDIATTIHICARHGASIVHRGGGTGLAGQTVSWGSVVIDSSKYCNHILSLDPEKREATIEPGCVLDDLRQAADKFGLTFGPDPSTHNHNTLGGMIGNNSCGVHSVYAHRTVENVHALDVLTYDGLRMTVGKTPDDVLNQLMSEPGRKGEIYRGLKRLRDTYGDEIRRRYPKIPRRVSGYSLDELLPENGFHVARALVGSESTCVTILRATVGLVIDPPYKVLLVIGFTDVTTAADAVPTVLLSGPIGVEGLDEDLTEYMRRKNYRVADLEYLPVGRGWLMAQFGGNTEAEASEKAAHLQNALRHNKDVTGIHLWTHDGPQEALRDVREAGLGSTAFAPGLRDTWEGWEDSAVAPENLGAYMRDLKALYAKHGYHGAMYGHFGDGLIHTRIDFGLHTPAEVKNFRQFLEEAAGLVVRHGGSLSGEHGDGRSRAELLPIMFGPRLIEAFEDFKRLWDPQNKMNPGKIVFPKPLDTDLRYGPEYEKRKPAYETLFKFPESQRRFDRAVIRCVGVGECRRKEKGVMCPSYRATREEKHSTRGRSRLLQEMLEHGPITDDWKSIAVADSLDLCLSCKGCKKDCPVSVDMATYRAEFYYHHYQHKMRPISSYTMGLVHRWAPLATRAPRLANILTQTPVFGLLSKLIGGVHPRRALPKLAVKNFRAEWKEAEGLPPAQPAQKERVILWADTFNNYFTPAPLLAAAKVLHMCGYEVIPSPQGLCCGRPFYDFGRLEEAKQFLARCIEGLTPLLNERTWLVGVEPSCLSVFRDEIVGLFPDDPRAMRVRDRAMTFGGFLQKHGHPPISTFKELIVHPHCHHYAVLGMEEEAALLQSISPKVDVLDKGCCGMAGAFGYERHKYHVSKDIANLALMPALRQASPKAVIIANGFSCRCQIADFTDRKALTLPEALLQAMEEKVQ